MDKSSSRMYCFTRRLGKRFRAWDALKFLLGCHGGVESVLTARKISPCRMTIHARRHEQGIHRRSQPAAMCCLYRRPRPCRTSAYESIQFWLRFCQRIHRTRRLCSSSPPRVMQAFQGMVIAEVTFAVIYAVFVNFASPCILL